MAQSLIPAPSYRTPGGVVTVTGGLSTTVAAAATLTACTYVVPANTIAVGTSYRLTAFGRYSNGTAAHTTTWQVRIGGVVLASVTLALGTTARTNIGWTINSAFITFPAAGSAGTAIGMLPLQIATNAAGIVIPTAVGVSSGQTAVGTATAGGAPIAPPTVNTLNPLTIDLAVVQTAVAGVQHFVDFAQVELVRL